MIKAWKMFWKLLASLLGVATDLGEMAHNHTKYAKKAHKVEAKANSIKAQIKAQAKLAKAEAKAKAKNVEVDTDDII